ncbi:MAG: penicillin-binding transpeptidase domain-containing protein [Oscillospiraceae bacterium]|jgi:penicillin-binding protein 2
MTKFFNRLRIIFLIAVLLTALSLSLIRLMKIQIVQGAELLAQSVSKTTGSQEILAPRGEILDINGNSLVINEIGYNVIIEKAFFPTDIQQQNKIILQTVNILEYNGFEWNDNTPITKIEPYTFLSDKETLVSNLKTNLRLNVYATSQNCIDKLIEMYEISDEYTAFEKRIIAGVRYEMLLQQFSVSNSFVLSEDVSFEVVAKLKEAAYYLEGIDVVEAPVRVYAQGGVFPHGIGVVGPVYADEYQALKDLGYKATDYIGKSGIEKAFESELRGINGERSVVISSDKTVVSIEETAKPVPGNTVQLTIDMDYQTAVQDILAERINWLHEMDDLGKDAQGGAIVVLDVKTGAVLAMATYPSYDINDYLSNYSEVASRELNPLFNRAIDGLYRPGSTFKPITAIAGLTTGLITKDYEIYSSGVYTYYEDYKPEGTEPAGYYNVVTALQWSSNIYFYDLGRRLTIGPLVEFEEKFGFGVDLGLEIGGKTGYLASPETFSKLNMDWTPGQLLMASIGQSEIAISPLAMASEALTLATGGTRYRPYVVDSIWSYDRQTLISKTQPVVESVIEDPTGTAFEAVKEGMVLASQKTVQFNTMAGKLGEDWSLVTLPYPVAIKTGTPESGRGTDSAVIGFYPADDPEIAFAVMIEGGEYSKYAVRKIIDAYYGYNTVVQSEQN